MATLPEPEVVRVAREFQSALLREEAAQMAEMTRRWLDVEKALEGNVDALAQEIASMASQGKTINIGKVHRLGRYRRLLAQAMEQTGLYARYADGIITQRQTALISLGIDHGVDLIGLAGATEVGMVFDRLPVAAMEQMVQEIAGTAGDGGPLGKLLRLRMVKDENGLPLPGVAERLEQTLVNASAQGWGPRKTARMMQNDLAGGLDKALQISRSEQLRAYRMANAKQYAESGVVRAQARLCAHGSRTCAACLADEGAVYPADVAMPEHTQGRCRGIPVLSGLPMPTWTKGEEWLKTQDEETQRSILGPGRFAAWKDGQFQFSELVVKTRHPVWGDGIATRPLRDLTGGPAPRLGKVGAGGKPVGS